MFPLKSHSNPWGKLSNKHPHISRSSQNYSQALKGFGQVMASDGLETITACKVTASSVMLSVGPIKVVLISISLVLNTHAGQGWRAAQMQSSGHRGFFLPKGTHTVLHTSLPWAGQGIAALELNSSKGFASTEGCRQVLSRCQRERALLHQMEVVTQN